MDAVTVWSGLLERLRHPERGERDLAAIAARLEPELREPFFVALRRAVAHCADADLAIHNLERLLAQPPARQAVMAHLSELPVRLEKLVQLLGVSQLFADTLVRCPQWLDVVLVPVRHSPGRSELLEELRQSAGFAQHDGATLQAFRRFRRRHLLRIGIDDIIHRRPLEEIARNLALLADVCLQGAMEVAEQTLSRRWGTPTTPQGRPARCALLALGKLGGEELNYSSDLDVLFVYDQEGETTGRRVRISNQEFFSRLVSEVVRLLGTHTEDGIAYRMDLRLRPEGRTGPLVRSLQATRHYYDTIGRTWERQALIKLRPVAGDLELGRELVRTVQPFVYRKFLSFSEIHELKAMKRRMEERAKHRRGVQVPSLDVKHGPGGIRDIEYTVQFLQLLNGGDLPAVRQRNTLLALEALEIAGCLTPQETYRLAEAYRFLRTTEHRLQLFGDLQTHTLPDDAEQLRLVALRLGYGAPSATRQSLAAAEGLPGRDRRIAPPRRSPLDEPGHRVEPPDPPPDPLQQFVADLESRRTTARAVLEHVLHQAFMDTTPHSEPETDLILDPEPDPQTIHAVLSRYPFRDIPRAYANLQELARESVPFLSSRRCRHFLASIAPRLLAALAGTADPDDALNQLERVSASLGAKAVLWELFHDYPACLQLYVELCASSHFLSSLLVNNPGMIDELLDSLVMHALRPRSELQTELEELCRGAVDCEPILHSFQDKELLRIGVGDLLGYYPIRQTAAALTDLAEVILQQIVRLAEAEVQPRWGTPQRPDGGPCHYALVGLGKLGGREMSYHSDLDLILIYAADGTTTQGQANAVYFAELMRAIIRMASQLGPLGRLYAVDMRLRPTGKSGALALPLAEFERYFHSSACQLWERQALTRARTVAGEATFAATVAAAVREAVLAAPWTPACVDEWDAMRRKLEATASPRSLKRAVGGIADVEFVLQLLQLKYGRDCPAILQPNIWDAIDTAERHQLLNEGMAAVLRNGYSFLRLAEARLRIMTDHPLTELPQQPAALEQLARRMGLGRADRLLAEHQRHTEAIRRCYQQILRQERAGKAAG